MNTHGHEEVAKAAGLPLLEEVFGKDKRSLHAFHLGNWLTDVSQTVDPVAYRIALEKIDKIIDDEIKKSFDNLIDENVSTIFEWFDIESESSIGQKLKSLKPDITPYVEEAKKSLHKSIDFYVTSKTDERDSPLAKFFRDSFLVAGYYKFVHPDARNKPMRMNFECFMRVFGRPNDARGASGKTPANDRPGAFTQYYPYEHLDRPECFPPKDPPVFAPGPQGQIKEDQFQTAPGKPRGMRSPRSLRYKEEIEPDLYSYLRDDIEMTAGLLAEVERDFAEVYRMGRRDEDPKWYITLAKLGHAMHQVEDFFAHSNWVELAAKRLGPDFLSKAIQAEKCERASTIFKKRLKRHLTEKLKDWNDHPEEEWVVTGFFDFKDTLISLVHISEELWGGHVPDPCVATHDLFKAVQEAKEKPKTVLFKAQKTMQFTLDFLTDPKRALEDRENYIAQDLKKKFEPDLKKLLRPGISEIELEKESQKVARDVAKEVAKETEYLRSAPREIQDAFHNVIVEGGRVKAGWSIYKSIRDISEFIKDPVGWLLDWLPKYLKQKVKDALKFYVKERVYDWGGASRIGCHSLLAKDHDLEPFYKYQKECATAVHWYIVKTLLRRWTSKDSVSDYVDWLELLEYFLCNPQVPQGISCKEVEIEIPVTLVHTVARNEQLGGARDPLFSLEDKFRATACELDKFNWKTTADANFGTTDLPIDKTRDVINKILKDHPRLGYAVKPPNYAFQPGVRILIPGQCVKVIFRIPVEADPPWFQVVMEKGWKIFTGGYVDPEKERSEVYILPHEPKMIPADQLKVLIECGANLRRKAREAYRFGARSQCP